MRVIAVTALLVAACVAVTSAQAARAARPGPPLSAQWAPGYVISYTETVRDAAGNVVSRVQQDGLPAGATLGNADIAHAGLASATHVDAGSNLQLVPAARRLAAAHRRAACCSSGGSDTVEFTVTKNTLFGFTAWRYHQVVHWCWSYPSITCFDASGGFYDVDSQQVVHSGDNGYGWYYNWAGSGTGGHYSHREGSVSNCIIHWGCISNSYPYVDIWVNGNGAWSGSGGGN